MRQAASRLRGCLGLSEGQAYVYTIGFVVAIVSAVGGIAPTIGSRDPAPAIAMPSPTESGVSSNPPGASSERPFAGAAALPPTQPSPPASDAPDTPPASEPSPVGESYSDGGPYGLVERLAAVDAPGQPNGIAVGADGGFYVSTDNADTAGGVQPSRILRYSPTGELEREYPIEGQPAGRVHGLKGLVLGGSGLLYALDGASGRILRLNLETGEHETWSSLPDVPLCLPIVEVDCEPGLRDNPPVPVAAAFSSSGDLFVSDAGQAMVWKVSQLGVPEPWLADPAFASPTGFGPAGLQFNAAGDLVVTVTASLVGLTGGVFLVDVNDRGDAGDVTQLYLSVPGEQIGRAHV